MGQGIPIDLHTFEIIRTGKASVTGDDRSGSGLWAASTPSNTFTLVHNLGYAPAFLVFGDRPDGGRNFYPGGYWFNAAMGAYPYEAEVQVYSSDNEFKIFFSTRGGSNFSSTTLNMLYYLLGEKAR